MYIMWERTTNMKSTFTMVMEVEQEEPDGKMTTVPTFYIKGDPLTHNAIASFLHQTANEIALGKITLSKRN